MSYRISAPLAVVLDLTRKFHRDPAPTETPDHEVRNDWLVPHDQGDFWLLGIGFVQWAFAFMSMRLWDSGAYYGRPGGVFGAVLDFLITVLVCLALLDTELVDITWRNCLKVIALAVLGGVALPMSLCYFLFSTPFWAVAFLLGMVIWPMLLLAVTVLIKPYPGSLSDLIQ